MQDIELIKKNYSKEYVNVCDDAQSTSGVRELVKALSAEVCPAPPVRLSDTLRMVPPVPAVSLMPAPGDLLSATGHYCY